MRAYDVIKKKRDKKILTKDEIDFFISGCVNNQIKDYQASAFLMATYLNGMNNDETSFLTEAMSKSGDQIDLSSIPGIKVDKHSTGGVGDKTTLIIGPIVAACGVPFAKMSGRGLSYTGGTIDKLESIPGFKTQLKINDFIENTKKTNLCIAGQTGNMAPADKKFYALRDVTATVSSTPLIASSIMSKKIAAGADKIILDVKTGSGSFMKTLDDSLKLAKEMVKIGNNVGKETIALITEMDQPLGNAVGNSLEMIEAIDSLKGEGPSDLLNLCILISVEIVKMSLGIKDIQAKDKVLRAISEKTALEKLKEMIENQKGDSNVIYDYSLFKQAKYKSNYFSIDEGYIGAIKADKIGTASMVLGAGREYKEEKVDSSAGIYFHKKEGDKISKGELIATLYSDTEEKINESKKLMDLGILYSVSEPKKKDMVLAKVTTNGVENKEL